MARYTGFPAGLWYTTLFPVWLRNLKSSSGISNACTVWFSGSSERTTRKFG